MPAVDDDGAFDDDDDDGGGPFGGGGGGPSLSNFSSRVNGIHSTKLSGKTPILPLSSPLYHP